mmetsp:Transcript_14998/g.36719  ORF Transcript_14998/g.36719 Transcript_14998/m.36719 type:complete len:306 (+) Transcript_14998:363-1280(+)
MALLMNAVILVPLATSLPIPYHWEAVTSQPQLNATAFAACLSPPGVREKLNLRAIRLANNLTIADGILSYLSVYAGERLPLLNKTVQQPSYERFSVAYEMKGKALATKIVNKVLARPRSQEHISPGFLFRTASSICNDTDDGPGDSFCAALMCHNVLRAIGRRATYIDKHGVDYAPGWLRANETYWMKTAEPALQAAMLPLRNDGGGDKWGEWYHVFGLLAYGIHEASILSNDHAAVDIDKVIAAVDTLINAFITPGHKPEDTIKAQIDRDTSEVLRHFLFQDYPPSYTSHTGCTANVNWYVVSK